MGRNDLDKSVRENLTAAIKNSGRSEASLARETGIALSTLRRKLAGLNRASFTVTDLTTIGAALECDPVDLLTDSVAS